MKSRHAKIALFRKLLSDPNLTKIQSEVTAKLLAQEKAKDPKPTKTATE
jgi:hypothetical protein